MGSIYGEDSSEWLSQCSSTHHEEKIFVAVRIRPLNDRELSKHDVSDWECIDHTTIIFKNSLQERAMPPTAYSFDRVFGCDTPTTQVYEEAAKSIVLSVLSGINSTIFAYGQTSSGKTYTMSGITWYAIEDIYDYISKHGEREFVLKFSAMEIYNESVKDLLCPETQLRLLDDPERGTVVDKLTELTVRDSDHLKELLSACEAQRQIGETALNEVSSRSHQILRLTVESETREYYGAENSSTLTASVNFVDLAGSERASQTVSAGTRLKEGCHINRSLLTLGTVIRKLSKGRNGHVPYRDSKLTRILQNSLGGNARTAIICTMSPAHTHVEQSRNTLLFASCAKQVSTNSQVNVVMSEKALVKQLQRELVRLENELRNLSLHSGSGASASVLKEKELLIEKMDKEIKELTHQRDLARSRIEDMIRSGVEFQSKSWIHMNNHNHEKGSWTTDEYSASEASEIIDPHRFDSESRTSHFSDRYDGVISQRMEENFLIGNGEEQFLSDDTSPRLYIDKYFGPDPCKGWEKIAPEPEPEPEKKPEDICKEAQCIEIDFTKRNAVSSASSPQLELISGHSPSLSEHDASEHGASVSRSISCAAILTMLVDSQTQEEDSEQIEDTEQDTADDVQENLSQLDSAKDTDMENEKYNNSLTSSEDSTDKKQEMGIEQHGEVIEPDPVKVVEENLDLKEGAKTAPKLEDANQSSSDWFVEFERQKKEIIQLWHDCNIPLVHRTYFLLLFKGDPTDSVYMEVELRRLSFIKDTLHGARVIEDDQFLTKASSAKSVNRERVMLARRMLKKFTTKEREAVYEKWGVDIKSKQRRLQLCKRLWIDTTDMEHVNESASIVAKLMGLKEKVQAPKEMFGLSFPIKPAKLRSSSSWRHSLPM